MIWLSDRIEKIENLVKKDNPESLTYAALEARITIEQVCYDRLRIAHDYISHDDIKKWQPKEVVNILLQEVDVRAAEPFSLYMSNEPTNSDLTKEEFEKIEYTKIGEQAGLDAKKLGKLWNALSSFLHVRLPKTKQDKINSYGEVDKLKRKIEETLSELEVIAKGTLIMSGFGESVSFECYCGSTNKRSVSQLHNGQTINCHNRLCPERWEAIINHEGIKFERRVYCVNCRACSEEIRRPEKETLTLKMNGLVEFSCSECGEKNAVSCRLMQVK